MSFNPNRVLLVERHEGNLFRAVLFDIDPDTGARSVMDIMVMERDQAAKAARVVVANWGTDWLFDGRRCQEIDFGRTHSPAGMLARWIEQL